VSLQIQTCLQAGLGGKEIPCTYSRTSGPPNCFTRIPRIVAISENTFLDLDVESCQIRIGYNCNKTAIISISALTKVKVDEEQVCKPRITAQSHDA